MRLKKLMIIMCCLTLVFTTGVVTNVKVEAKATSKAMKYLKGTWLYERHSSRSKVIFTKKYMKSYSLTRKNGKLVSPKKKGKYIGKAKILSTRKEGKRWVIKIKEYGHKSYLVSDGNELMYASKSNGKWVFDTYNAIYKYSKKIYK